MGAAYKVQLGDQSRFRQPICLIKLANASWPTTQEIRTESILEGKQFYTLGSSVPTRALSSVGST